MLALGVALLPVTRGHGLYLLDAVYLAFVFGQIGFLGHDAAHRAIFREQWKSTVFCIVHGNLLLGMSYGWWTHFHNKHHRNPNCADLDGDLEIAGLAFTKEQALKRHGVLRLVTKYQAYTFFPFLALTALGLRVNSVQALLHANVRHRLAEAFFAGAHAVLYCWFVFSSLGGRRGALFILLHQMLFGLYLGSAFAPNHKGMLMWGSHAPLDFLRKQILTARNVTPGVMTDFWYGGLNYQIEHHLFPSMPRNRLREAREIVMAFCRAHAISYTETGVMRSYRDILRYLHNISGTFQKATPHDGDRSSP
jgi:fatty acid desaturase